MATLRHICGADYEEGAEICGGCLGPIQSDQTVAWARPVVAVPSVVPERDHADVVQPETGQSETGRQAVACGICGAPAHADQASCDFCGAELSAAAAPLREARLLLPGGRELSVTAGSSVILGRHSQNLDIAAALADCDAVSRQHADLLITDSRIQVRDLGSTNGTFVNGQRAEPMLAADLGAAIRIGLGREVTIVVLPIGAHQ